MYDARLSYENYHIILGNTSTEILDKNNRQACLLW